MPLKSSPALPGYHDYHASQFRKWGDIIKNDPRRVCRTLGLYSPRGETVEGDTHGDVPILFQELKTTSRQSTSQAWKGLVDAGVITALCKCAINSEATLALAYATVNEDGVAEVSQEGMDLAQENAPAPYGPALEVLCNAAVSCAVPATSTEHKMIEELKKHWSTIMQRLWSEPSRTLDYSADPMIRVRDRVVVAQIVHRLSFVDPTFLDVILKPSDLTLAVCFRYWLYSTAEFDDVVNCSLIAPLLDGMGPDHWKRYFAEHPLPDMHTLLPRVLLGASRGMNKMKRTPNQSAEFIVAMFANHFRRLTARELNEELIFFTGLLNAAKEEYPPFCRALYRSEPLWAAMALNVTRYAPLGPNAPKTGHVPEGLTMASFSLYFNVYHTPEGKDHIDELVYSWLAGGLIDALEAAITTIIRSVRGPMLVSAILSMLDSNLPKFNAKTRSKLRAGLPRPRLMFTLIMLATKGSQNVDDLLALVAEDTVKSSTVPVQDPRHPMWARTAWQLLLRLTNTMRPFRGTCSRRGCEKPAYSGGCARCKFSAYCGQECMTLDDEHKFVCKWVPTLMIVDMYLRRDQEEVAKLLGNGVAPEPPADVAEEEELLRRVGESGSMTEEEIQEVLDRPRKLDEAKAANPDDRLPGVALLQKEMERIVLSGGPRT